MNEQFTHSVGQLRARLEWISNEVGSNTDLQKEVLAEICALELQRARDHFEGRLEYARQVSQHRESTLHGLVEYGLQTLKWSFLLNAGAIAIVMAYVGSAAGREKATAAVLISKLWPFALGCILVTISGAAGFFNFSYYELHLPTPEALNNFLSPQSTTWPIAKGRKPDESVEQFTSRLGWKSDAWRNCAILAAIGSAICFLFPLTGLYAPSADRRRASASITRVLRSQPLERLLQVSDVGLDLGRRDDDALKPRAMLHQEVPCREATARAARERPGASSQPQGWTPPDLHFDGLGGSRRAKKWRPHCWSRRSCAKSRF